MSSRRARLSQRARRRVNARAAWCLALIVGVIAAGFAVQYGLAGAASRGQPTIDASALFSSFNAAHFQPNYVDQGFIKRGLIGTLFRPLPDAIHHVAVIVFNVVALVSLAILLVCVLLSCRRRIDCSGFILLASLWIAAPAGVINLGYDFGRLDHVNIVLLALSLIALRTERLAVGAVLACLSTVAALLVHEAYLFYGLPLLIALGLLRFDSRSRYPRLAPAIGIAVSAILTLFALWRWGRYEGTRSGFVAGLDGALDPSHNVLHVWSRSLAENLAYVGARLSNGLFTIAEIMAVVALALAMLMLLVAVYRGNRVRLDLAVLAPLAVLPLFVLGIDYARWVALLWLMVVTIITHGVATGRFERLLEPPANVGLTVVLAASLSLGPIGTVHLFPLARAVLSAG